MYLGRWNNNNPDQSPLYSVYSKTEAARKGKNSARVGFPYLFSIFRSENNRRLTVSKRLLRERGRLAGAIGALIKQSRSANHPQECFRMKFLLEATIAKQRYKLCAEAESTKKISNAIQILWCFRLRAICVDAIKIESARSRNHELFIQNRSLINKVYTFSRKPCDSSGW